MLSQVMQDRALPLLVRLSTEQFGSSRAQRGCGIDIFLKTYPLFPPSLCMNLTLC